MNCKQARHEIALWVGQDLDDPQQGEVLRKHLAQCPDCRSYHAEMQASLQLLEQADRPATYLTVGSLWPELAPRLQRGPVAEPAASFRNWIPFAAMTAACLILMLVLTEDRPLTPPPRVRGLVIRPAAVRHVDPSRWETSSRSSAFDTPTGQDELSRREQMERLRRQSIPPDGF